MSLTVRGGGFLRPRCGRVGRLPSHQADPQRGRLANAGPGTIHLPDGPAIGVRPDEEALRDLLAHEGGR